MTSDPLAALARALGGEIVDGRYVLAPGPRHSPDDRSLSVSPSASAPSGFVVWRICREHVLAALDGQALAPSGPAQARKPRGGDLWKKIWLHAKNPLEHIPRAKRRPEQKSCVEKYLNSRGLELPPSIADEVIRYDPRCHFGDEIHQAMIALVRDIFTDAGIGIHRTALTPDGLAVKRNGETLRMSLGTIAGGAIKIDNDADVTMGLVLGEGLETCLTARQQFDRAPCWSAVNSGGIASFAVLPGIEGLTLLRENDDASSRAVEVCARRWHDAGRDVRICDPEPEFSDLNDELREARR